MDAPSPLTANYHGQRILVLFLDYATLLGIGLKSICCSLGAPFHLATDDRNLKNTCCSLDTPPYLAVDDRGLKNTYCSLEMPFHLATNNPIQKNKGYFLVMLPHLQVMSNDVRLKNDVLFLDYSTLFGIGLKSICGSLRKSFPLASDDHS